MRGYIQVYTGDGKGKTTAALGLVIRAAGAGLKIFIGQFIKKGNFSEIAILKKRFPEVKVKQFGTGCFVRGAPCEKEITAAQKGMKEMQKAVSSGKYGLVIADEICPAVKAGVVSLNQLIELINTRRPDTELVITGRNAPKEIIDLANLVTEMKEIKHYWHNGVKARKGIEY